MNMIMINIFGSDYGPKGTSRLGQGTEWIRLSCLVGLHDRGDVFLNKVFLNDCNDGRQFSNIIPSFYYFESSIL